MTLNLLNIFFIRYLNSTVFIIYLQFCIYAFRALLWTMLDGWQEGFPSCKNLTAVVAKGFLK